MTKLSIIIPTYNEGPYLRRCLDSITKVKEWPAVCHDVEVLIINDGSTDNTDEVLEPYVDLVGVRYYKHKTSWGVSMARNHGLVMALGEYITFLDADDKLAPNAVIFMLRHIDEGIQTPVVMFNHMRVYSPDTKPVAKFTNTRGFYYFTRGQMPQKWTTVWGKIFKAKFLTENGIRFHEGISYGEDELFLLECFRIAPRFYHVPEVAILKHYDNPASLTKNLTKKIVNDFMRAEIAMIEEDNPPEFDAALRRLIAEHWNASAFIGIYGR